jgi:signal transduction histidine kinase
MTSVASPGAFGDAQFRREASHALSTPLGSLLLQAELIEHLLRRRDLGKAQAAAGALVTDCEVFGRMLHEVFAAMADMAEDGAVNADPQECLVTALDEIGDVCMMTRYRGDAPRVALPTRALGALMRRVVMEASTLGACAPYVVGVREGLMLRLSLREASTRTAVLRDAPFEGPKGLNLWTAREIARRHHGALVVPTDASAVLEIILPIAPSAAHGAP